MKTRAKKPNFRVKHPYGYLIKSMLVGFVLVFCSIFSMATGIVDLTPNSSSLADGGNLSDSWSSTYNPNATSKGFASGTGTKNDPFIIKTIAQWRCFADFVYYWNGGYGYYFALGANINFNAGDYSTNYYDDYMVVGNTIKSDNSYCTRAFESLDTSENSAVNVEYGRIDSSYAGTADVTAKGFAGVFYGNGYKLSNINISTYTNSDELCSNYGGVFGFVSGMDKLSSNGATPNAGSDYTTAIYDLVLENVAMESFYASVYDDCAFGCLASVAQRALISNVYVMTSGDTISGNMADTVGGIVGEARGCQFYGCKVEGYTLASNADVGGIVGVVNTSGYGNTYFVNCTTDVIVEGYTSAGCGLGGIIGRIESLNSSSLVILRNCWSTSKVYLEPILGDSSTNGNTTMSYNFWIECGALAGLVGSDGSADGYANYLYILNCYNAEYPYVKGYLDGDTSEGAEASYSGYGLAYSYKAVSGYKNYYNSYSDHGSSDNYSTTYEIRLGYNESVFKTAFDSNYVAESGVNSGYAFSYTSVFPVNGSTGGTSVTKNGIRYTSNYYSQIGATVAKGVFVEDLSGTLDMYDTNTTSGLRYDDLGWTRGTYYLRMPNSSTASSVKVTGNAGQVLDITVKKYSQYGLIKTTNYIVKPSSTTTKASKTISFDCFDICEYDIIVNVSNLLSGQGTVDSPYLIKTASDLSALGRSDAEYHYFTLANDITVSADTYVNGYGTLVDGTFQGYLDGCGYTLDITALGGTVPIFRAIGSSGVVHNLNIVAQVNYYNSSSNSVVYPEDTIFYDSTNSSFLKETFATHIGFTLAGTNAGIVDAVNLYIDGDANVSIFSAYIESGAPINCGLLIAENSGTIKNCYVGKYDISENMEDKYYASGSNNSVVLSLYADASILPSLYIGGLCGANYGSIIGNSVEIWFYDGVVTTDGSAIIDSVINNAGTVFAGGVVGYDKRSSNILYLSDNWAIVLNEFGITDFPNMQYCTGGIAGVIANFISDDILVENTTHNISTINAGYFYMGALCGYTDVVGFDAYNFTYNSSYVSNNNGEGGNTATAIATTSATPYGDESDKFDSAYWIAISGTEGVTKLAGSYYSANTQAFTYYPRSIKIYDSTVHSNNWSKNNTTSLSISSTTTSINISSAAQLGALAEYINKNGQGNLTRINITDDIYLYGKYWTPIKGDGFFNVYGNGHTIYGLDSLGSNGGGLFGDSNVSIVHNLNFEDCLVKVGTLSSESEFGIITNVAIADLTVTDVTFTNCHICIDSLYAPGAIRAGFVTGWAAVELTLDNVTIEAEYDGDTLLNSSVDVKWDRRRGMTDSLMYIGGLVGSISAVFASNITVNGFDIDIDGWTSGFANVYGGLFGNISVQTGSYLKDSNIVALNIDSSDAEVDDVPWLGGIVGQAWCDFEIDSCIIDIDMLLGEVDYCQARYGGICGYGQVLTCTNNDINIRLNFSDYALQSQPGPFYLTPDDGLWIAGIATGDADMVLTFDNNIFRLESNVFARSATERDYPFYGISVLCASDEGFYSVNYNNNLFYFTANNYNYVRVVGCNYTETITQSNNVFYTSNDTAVAIFLDGSGITQTSLTTAQITSLVNGGNGLVGNDFFANKFIRTGWQNDGPYVRKFNEEDTYEIVPFKNYTTSHYFSPLRIGNVGFEVYNVFQKIDSDGKYTTGYSTALTKIQAYNSLGTSNTIVEIKRNGQYTLPYTAQGVDPTIFAVVGDTFEFVLNNNNYKYTVSLMDTDSSLVSTVGTELTADYTYTWVWIADDSYDYYDGYGWLCFNVDISQAYRYFAADADMEVSGAVAVDVRDGYVVYGAMEGADVTVKRTGNTTGYAASDSWSGVNFVAERGFKIKPTYIWTDGTNTYYSDYKTQYVLNGNTWAKKAWNGIDFMSGSNIWTDGTNIYYSNSSAHYVLDKSTSTWTEMTWTGLTSFYGNYIWTDGTNIYYSNSSTQYKLDIDASTWSEMTWTGLTPESISQIWTDGTNIYYSNGSTHYVLKDKDTGKWEYKEWSGLTSFYGGNIWTDGTNTYYSSGSAQYVLDKSTSTWTKKTWTGPTLFYGQFTWTDGINTYYSDGSSQYVLNGTKWESKKWYRYIDFSGDYIWTDGTNTYYSYSSTHYVLDKSTSTWTEMTWTGLSSFNGNCIWTDGTNIYYSYSSSTYYVLDKSTSTWKSTKLYTTTGETLSFNGNYIWTDGTNTYYSYSSTHYVLDKSTSTWTEMTWTGLTSFYGFFIWTDGTNIYYSYGSAQYVLDKSTNTWTAKTWSGLSSFDGNRIWTDGTNIYYSNSSAQYVLDKSTNTWTAKTWTGLTSFRRDYIWTDGTNTYCSNGSNSYVLDNAYVSGLTKGTLNSANSYTSASTISGTTGTNSNGYRAYTFTVSSSNTSTSMTGSLTAYSYSTEKMYEHSIENNAGLSSSQVYLTSSLTGSTKYTSLFTIAGTDIKLNYPATSGEYLDAVVTRTGTVENTAASGYDYTATTSDVVNTVTYSLATYEDLIFIQQEGSAIGNDEDELGSEYCYGDGGVINIPDEIWGDYDDDLEYYNYDSIVTWANSPLKNVIRKSAYVTIDNKNYLGLLNTAVGIFPSYPAEAKTKGTVVTATVHFPVGYKVGSITYNNVAITPTSTTTTSATFSYTVAGVEGAELVINVVQNKWNDSDNIVAPTGSGTSSSPYVIDTAAKFGWMVNKINSGGSYASAYYSIGADINLGTDANGNKMYIDPIKTFSGTISGSALYSIIDMNINQEYACFMHTNNGTISDLIFVDPCFTGAKFAGLVYNNGTFTSSSSCTTGTIERVGMRTDDSIRGLFAMDVVEYMGDVEFGVVSMVYFNSVDSGMNDVFCAVKVYGDVYGLAYYQSGTIYDAYTDFSIAKATSASTKFYALAYELRGYSDNNKAYVANFYTPSTGMSSVADTRYVFGGAQCACIEFFCYFVAGEYSNDTGYHQDGGHNNFYAEPVGKTTAELQDVNNYYFEDFSYWIFTPDDSDISNNIYRGQKYDPSNKYPLLTMGAETNLVQLYFQYTLNNNGTTTTGDIDSVKITQYGWSMENWYTWVEKDKAFSFKVIKDKVNYDTPVYLTGIKSDSGFSNSFELTPSRYATATYTITASNAVFDDYSGVIMLYFSTAESSFDSDYDIFMTGKEYNDAMDGRHYDYAVAASTTSNGTARAMTYNYSIDTAYGALVVQTLKVGDAEILSGHLTTAVTKYIYLNGTTYSAKDSKSGTGTYIGKVVVTPSSVRAGKIELYELKEDIFIVAELYVAYQVTYTGLNTSVQNTITTYYSTSAITTSTTSTKVADVRTSGGLAGTTSGSYYAPVMSSGNTTFVGSVIKGNSKSFTLGTAKHNNTTDYTNTNYASTADYAHSVGVIDLASTTNSVATLEYNFGPGAYDYTITLDLSKTATAPSAVVVRLLDSNDTQLNSISFTSVATNSKVVLNIDASLTGLKLEAVVTAASGKAYRVIWGSLTAGTAGNKFSCDDPTTARSYTLYVVELFKVELSHTKSFGYDGKTFTSTYKNYAPVLTITYASSGLVGSASGSVSNSASATAGSVTSSQIIDYGSNVTYSVGDRSGIGTYESGKVSINFSDVFSTGSLSTSSVSSIKANSTSSVACTIKVVTITTQITNKDLNLHPDTYIGIARRDLSDLGYNFSSSTLHTTDSDGNYYIYYNGLTASTGTGDDVVRGYRTFYVAAGEKVEARRWDLKGTGYANDIQSVTHLPSASANYTVEKKEGDTMLLGLDMYVKVDDTISFTYYPLVEISLTRNATTTSKYATDNVNTLLPINSERNSSANIMIKGTNESSGTYDYSAIDTIHNLFEPIVYMQITYRVPTANLAGWDFTGWTVFSNTFTSATTVSDIAYTPSIDTTSESGYTLYRLTFTIPKQETDENGKVITNSINNFQYKINFSEKTYALTANSYLMSGGSTSVNNTVANKALYEYTSSAYSDTGKITLVEPSTSAISYTAGYYGYYKVFYTSTDANNYEYASGDNGTGINGKTSTYNSTATFKKWHTISAPTITIDYYTDSYTDNQYVRTNSNYKYTFSACKTGTSTALEEIATITLSGITMKGDAMKVLEGAKLTVTYTTNTNKFYCITAPASKTITADTTITGAFAENIISVYFYKNTASSTKLNSTAVTLGSLNNAYTIPSTYQVSPGDEYVFEKWTSNGILTFANSATLSTSIVERSINGSNGSTYDIYANWRRVYYHTFTNGGVTTTHKTNNRTAAGGTLDLISVSSSPVAGTNGKYKYANTATASYTANDGYTFDKLIITGGTVSGNTISRNYSTCNITNGRITYGGSTLYVSGDFLYFDNSYVVHYGAYDYQISGSKVYIYDTADVTVVAHFEENTYNLNITQPSGGEITITSHTSSAPDIQYSNSLPTRITLGYFSTITLTYTNTDANYRFQGWNYDPSAYSEVSVGNQTITLGPNILARSTISVSESVQAPITFGGGVYLIRFLENSTAGWPQQSVKDIMLDGSKVVWIYDNFVLVYEVSGNNPIMTTSWTRTCTNSSHTASNLSERTAVCDDCKFTNVNMYVVLDDTNPDTLKITMCFGNYEIGGVNVNPNPSSAEFYCFHTKNVNAWKVNIGYESDYYTLTGDAKTSVVASIKASTAAFDMHLPISEFSSRLYDNVSVEDHTSSNNDKVYVATQNTPSLKVLEGENVTIVAEDYVASGESKSYKFSHWTFTPSDGTYGDADWMSTGSSTGTDISHNASNTFQVFASRAGVYTAHYTYAYSLYTDSGKTTDGIDFTTANVTSATFTATGTKYYSADSKYLAGSTVTLTAALQSGYAFQGWYLYGYDAEQEKYVYSKIDTNTTGFTTVSDDKLVFTVGGVDCDGNTISGVDLENNTIVFIGTQLLAYQFGGTTGAPSATYTVSGDGVYSVTGGTLSGNTATMTAEGGTFMTVYVKEGTTITFTMSKSETSARATGVLNGSTTLDANTIPQVTFIDYGISGLTYSMTALGGTAGKYEVVYTNIYSVVAKSAATVTDTHVTASYKDNISNSIITITASSTGITYNGVTYYDHNTTIELSATIPVGHDFVSWVTNSTTYTNSTQTITLISSITSLTLNISEIDYDISKVMQVSIPNGFNNNIKEDTTWTSDSFGSFAYTSDHVSDSTKVGYFGKITIGDFTSGKYLYISGSKAYYDSEYKHEVYSGLYSISGSTLTYLGAEYSISSNNTAEVWSMYTNPIYAVTGGTLSQDGITIENIRGAITITCTAEMQGKLNNSTKNNKTDTILDSASQSTLKMTDTVTYTAATKTGYVFKGWVEYNCNNVRNTAVGGYYSTASSITVTLNEENNGNYYVAVYNPTFSLTVGANTFAQCASIKVSFGDTEETLTNPTQVKVYSDIEWGTTITLVATPKGQNRTNYWSLTNGDQTQTSSGNTIKFNIQDDATAIHVFLTQHTITITHNKEFTTTGGTWSIQQSSLSGDEWSDWTNVTTDGFVGATGSKTFTKADEGIRYRVVITTNTHHYVTLSASGNAYTIDGSNNTYVISGTLTSYVYFNGADSNGVTEDSTLTISHTGLNYINITTSPSGLGNTVTVDENIGGSTSGTSKLSTIIRKNNGSAELSTTAVAGYDTPTWSTNAGTLSANSGLSSSLSYTWSADTLGKTYNITLTYKDNSNKSISLNVVGFTSDLHYTSMKGTTDLKIGGDLIHPSKISNLSLVSGVTSIRFSSFLSSEVKNVTLTDGTATSTVDIVDTDTYIEYTIPSGAGDSIALTLTITNNTWLDSGNYTAPSGSGTAADPYQIANAQNFAWISYKSAKDSESFDDMYFVQTGNIDLSGHLWLPIQHFNGVFVGSHDYLISNQACYDHSYHFEDDAFIENDYDYTIGSLFANSDGGVFKSLRLKNKGIYDSYDECGSIMRTGKKALLLGNGRDVVIDGIKIEESDFYIHGNGGALVAFLNGGKITNIYISCVQMNFINLYLNTLLICDIFNGDGTYYDSNGNASNVVIENVYIELGVAYSIIGNIHTDVSLLNIFFRGDVQVQVFIEGIDNYNATLENVVLFGLMGDGDIISTSAGTTVSCTDVWCHCLYDNPTFLNGTTPNGTTPTGVTFVTGDDNSTLDNFIKSLYNKGGNVWYYTSSTSYGMDLFGEHVTTSSDDTVTIEDGSIKLSGNVSITKFKNALSALATNSAVTKVELFSSIDFGGASLDTMYTIPAGKTFDGHGYTISGIKAVREMTDGTLEAGIFSQINGTLRRTTFENIYVYVNSGAATTCTYSHIGLIFGYSNGATISNVTVKNSRLNVVFDGLCAYDNTSYPNIGLLGGADDQSNFTYIDIINSKITFSQYGASTQEAFKIAGFIGYTSGGSINNVQVDTDIIVDSSSSMHVVSGFAGTLRTSVTNAAITGDITSTSSANNVYPIAGITSGAANSYSVSTAYVSGTFSPKASTLYGTTDSISYTNVYVSELASSASGTKTDAEMKSYSTYEGFNLDEMWYSTAEKLSWFMDGFTYNDHSENNGYPYFSVASNNFKFTLNLSGDGSSGVRANLESYQKSHVLDAAGTVNRLFEVNDLDVYNNVEVQVILYTGYYLDTAESTIDLTESSSPISLESWISSIGLTVDGCYSDDIFTLPMQSHSEYDVTLNLVVKKVDYTITATASGHGSVVSGAGSYKTGDTVTLVASANSSDDEYCMHQFVGWYKGSTLKSTNLTYSFTASESTAGEYEAKFCSGSNCLYKVKTSITSGVESTVSPSDTGFMNVGESVELKANLTSSEEIVSITRDGVEIYNKIDGVLDTNYTLVLTENTLTLSFTMRTATKGQYLFNVGMTSRLVTVNIPNVGGSTISETDAYSAHGKITLAPEDGTSSVIDADSTMGTVNVLYGKTLTITFMSDIRYKLDTVSTSITGGNTSFTTSTSTVNGYTRYTYTYTTDAIIDDTTITLNLVKDRWVDISYDESTSTYSFGAGHSTEFITANGGTAANEISTSSATFGTDQAYKGLSGNPIVISTAAQLARVSYLVNIGATFMTYIDGELTQVYYHNAYYKITADIDLNNYFWTPINAINVDTTYSVSTSMNIVSEIQNSIKNMYVRYDGEEEAIDHTEYFSYSGFFGACVKDTITGITFDNAVIYNSHGSGRSGAVAGMSYYSQFNFITVKNSTFNFASYGAGLVGQTIGDTFNYVNSISNTAKVIAGSTYTSFGGIVAYMYRSTINNASVSGLNIITPDNYNYYSFEIGGVVGVNMSSVVKDVVVDTITTNGNNIYLSSISYEAYYGSEYINVWSKESTYLISKNYSNSTINILSGTPNLSTLGLSTDTWYVSGGVAYTKGYGTGTNTISRIADITTGGFAGGTGTKSDPYLISTAEQFRYLQYLVNSGNTTYNSASKYYKITADLDLGGGISTMLGTAVDNNYSESNIRQFRGHLDGDFHTISNMIIFDPYNNKFVGFMPYPNTGATLKNLNLDNYTVIGSAAQVGGIVGCGYVGVNIDNINITNGYVAGLCSYLGGLVGYIYNTSSDSIVKNSSFSGILTGYGQFQGGIVGYVHHNNSDYNIYIQNCSTDGLLNAQDAEVGGILGESYVGGNNTTKTYITNCVNNMKLLVCTEEAGGIAGYTYNTEIENCYNNGEIVIYYYVKAESSDTYYNTDENFNNGTYSTNANYNTFFGEIVGRNHNNVNNTTVIKNTYYNEAKKIVLSGNSKNGILLPYGDKNILGHTPNGYSIWTTTREIDPTYTDNIGSAEMKYESELKELGNFSAWDTYTVWNVDGTSLPVHRWATQNRLYIEGEGLRISDDGLAVIVDGGRITFADGVRPVADSDGRIYVYASGSALDVNLVPDTNNELESAQVREYYGSTYTTLNSSTIDFDTYSDGTSFKVLKVSFVNSEFSITINTSLSRGNGIAIGEYETLHIVILNVTTNQAYTCTLDDGTYVFDGLLAGDYYVAVYTSMFFNVSNITCLTSGVGFANSEFYYTLSLSNSTSANAIINITANKTVDAWIYSKVEIGA